MKWDAEFGGLPPVKLPDGRKLETLGECAAYILGLPKRQPASPQWQGVTAELMKAAEHGSVFRFIARVAFGRALHGVSGVGQIPVCLTQALPGRRSGQTGSGNKP